MVETHRFVGISNQDMLGEMIQFDLSTNSHQLEPTIFGIYHLEPPPAILQKPLQPRNAQPSSGWLNHQVVSIGWSRKWLPWFPPCYRYQAICAPPTIGLGLGVCKFWDSRWVDPPQRLGDLLSWCLLVLFFVDRGEPWGIPNLGAGGVSEPLKACQS